LGEFLPIGRFFTYCRQFFNYRSSPNVWVAFFTEKDINVCILTKIGLGYIFGIFFTITIRLPWLSEFGVSNAVRQRFITRAPEGSERAGGRRAPEAREGQGGKHPAADAGGKRCRASLREKGVGAVPEDHPESLLVPVGGLQKRVEAASKQTPDPGGLTPGSRWG
jgi:hypothetical protein